MYHSDPMINIAVEHQAERVRAVQAYGQTHRPATAAPSWPIDDRRHNWRPGRVMKAGMVMAAAVPVALWVVWVFVAR
jgi:hypothetical protein